MLCASRMPWLVVAASIRNYGRYEETTHRANHLHYVHMDVFSSAGVCLAVATQRGVGMAKLNDRNI